MKGVFSLQGKFAFFCAGLVAGVVAIVGFSSYYLSPPVLISVTLLILVPLSIILAGRFVRPVVKLINALADSTDNIRGQDFSITIASSRADELGHLVARHNELGQLLREERHSINQRELLLDTVLQATPVAMWLCDEREFVVYANLEARQLLAEGRRIQGEALGALLGSMDERLADAIRSERDGLASMEVEGETEAWYVSCRFFNLNARTHRLHLVRRMTREFSRQEVNTWKRVIRLISHELNNSLAPISSLSHSGRLAMDKLSLPDGDADAEEKLRFILESIGERAGHLKEFIEGYARFARLPAPRRSDFDLLASLRQLRDQYRFELYAETQVLTVSLDQGQIEQVMINLLKNARDAAGAEGSILVRAEVRGDRLLLSVCDDGPGMSGTVLQQSLLPFYSTKQEGTGLGLPLCREITEAHGGQLSIRNREPSGLEVILHFPNALVEPEAGRG